MKRKLVLSTTVLASMAMMVGVASAAAPNTALQIAHTNTKIKANSTPTYQNGVTPAQMRHAYGLDKITNNGAGQTVAIVDAYGSPTIANDLNVFNQQFGLPAANLTVHNMGGKRTDGGWALETSLDVEWVHALAPSANILLVEAKSASTTDLISAIDYATSNGAIAVSNSWGGSEFSSEASYDSHFQKTGVVTLASSGDNGAGASWPASSPYVVSVGGTTLNIDSAGTYSSESAWSGSGGATSAYESALSYQSNWSSVTGGMRGIPDVAMDADPNSGVAVYDSTADQGQTGWFQVGGTSLSCPMWAALVALADQSRTTKLSSVSALNALYNMAGTTGSTGYTTNFHDITSGSNGNAAKAGYDLVTGLGSPKADALIPNLISAP